METKPLGTRESQCYLKHWAHVAPKRDNSQCQPKQNFPRTIASRQVGRVVIDCGKNCLYFPVIFFFFSVLLNTMIQISLQSNGICLKFYSYPNFALGGSHQLSVVLLFSINIKLLVFFFFFFFRFVLLKLGKTSVKA